ncbi:MAG: RHS repeat-associated core domain-containing protein, partial [Clostridia bacterium]|nr:RHS repeat-associated core domain-containing protein [Clostridia bacterium]
INPFRYRGYYQDEETGFYYLNSRYYDPQVKRFLNADDPSYLGANGDLQAYNLYAYCSNNPVMGYDPLGRWTISFALSFSITFFDVFGISISAFVTLDEEGNVALQTSYADITQNGGVGLPAVNFSSNIFVTKEKNYRKLEGQGISISGGYENFGGELLFSTDESFSGIGFTLFNFFGDSLFDVNFNVLLTNTRTSLVLAEGWKWK